MPLVNYRVKVHASANKLWDMMLDKMRRPDKYVPGIVRVAILREHSATCIEREMETAQGKVIRELIVAEPLTLTVIFKSYQDEVYSGFVTNTIFEEDDGVYLDYTLNWTLKPGKSAAQPDSFWQETIKNAVLHAKQLAES